MPQHVNLLGEGLSGYSMSTQKHIDTAGLASIRLSPEPWAQVVKGLWTSSGAVTPRDFLSVVGRWDSRFKGGRQHDSQVGGEALPGAFSAYNSASGSRVPREIW